MTVSTPMVSVIMPVWNGEKYVGRAVESILGQTLSNFEFIIVNDGSTDGTARILESFRLQDDRISICHQPKLGFTEALNRACASAQGKYLARMDADDFSLPQRFERQVEFLEAHPDCDVCGSWVTTFGVNESRVIQYPTDAQQIKCRLLFDCCLAHPSVMMRKALFSERGLSYEHEFEGVSDYALWVEVSKSGALANLPEVLVQYRVHESQVSARDRLRQQQLAHQIRLRQLKNLQVDYEPKELELHRAISLYQCIASREFVERSESWLLKLQAANANSNCYDARAFSDLLADYWLTVCSGASSLGFWTFKKFSNSKLSQHASISFARRLRLFLKCLARMQGSNESEPVSEVSLDSFRNAPLS